MLFYLFEVLVPVGIGLTHNPCIGSRSYSGEIGPGKLKKKLVNITNGKKPSRQLNKTRTDKKYLFWAPGHILTSTLNGTSDDNPLKTRKLPRLRKEKHEIGAEKKVFQ
jgi:hypothetical protein